MKKLLHDLFYVPKYGKVTEKALFGRLSVYITIIVLCMGGMAFTAYAYFSASVLSGNNAIQAAHFDVEISVAEVTGGSDGKAQSVPVTVFRDGANEYHAAMVAGKKYLVTVKAIGTANTGFVLITVGNSQYFTQQIFRETAPLLTFTLVPAENLDVSFMPHFGTSSRFEDYQNGVADPFYVTEGGLVNVTGQSQPSQDSDGDQKEQEETKGTEDSELDQVETQVPEKHYHLIQNGENLQAIANLYQVDMEELIKLNDIVDKNVIIIGTKLLLPDDAIILSDMLEQQEPTENS